MTSPFRAFSSFAFRNTGSRLRILVWSTLIALVAGVFIGEPIEDMMRYARTAARAHPSTGSIVVIGQDNRSLDALGAWPWPRRHDAQVIDALFARGARRVMFDRIYAYPSTPADDHAFAAALKRYPGRVTLGARFDVDGSTGKRVPLLPLKPFRDNAQLASLNVWYNWMGVTSGVPYNSDIGGKLTPSFAMRLAGGGGASTDTFRPDSSIATRSVPTVSFIDALRGAPASDIVFGRDVLIGTTAYSLGDIHHLATQGPVPGVYIHAIAAETLLRGNPGNIGLMPGLAVALAAVAAHLLCRTRRIAYVPIAAGYAILFFAPLALDARSIDCEIIYGLILLSVAVYKSRHATSTRTNAVSGLPNLKALKQDVGFHHNTIVALKIKNYSEITASFAQDMERTVVNEIARRLGVGERHHAIYHVEDSLLWFSSSPRDELTDHIEGLHALFSAPLRILDRAIDLSVGFGIDTGVDRLITSRVGSVLVCAEEAAAAGCKWKLYDPRRLKDADWRLSLLGQLDAAIENGEVWVAYQPKLDLATNRLIGAEALVRWSHPERGNIDPVNFVLAAEQSNRIDRLTFFVLDAAVKAAADLNSSGADFGIAVNLSVRMLMDATLPDRVQRVLRDHRLPAERLTLEITESGELDAGDGPMLILHALRAIGVNVSIDDYGTGFSTLDYVKMIPANEIKIDKHFVDSIDTDEKDQIMVRSTIELAHSLGRKVVAEGVETRQVLRKLTALGCDVVQGYLIARPMRLAALEGVLRRDRQRNAA